MFSFKDGTLRIGFQHGFIDILWEACLFVLLISVTTFGDTVRYSRIIYLSAFFSFLAVSFVKYISNSRATGTVTLTPHFLWYASFIILALMSLLWADDKAAVFVPMKKMIQNFLICFCIVDNARTSSAVRRIMYLYLFASVFMCLFVLIKTPFSQWENGYIGLSVTGINSNDIGYFAALAFNISFFFSYVLRDRKWLNYTFMVLFFSLAVLSSSKKALLICLGGVFLTTLFSSRKKNISVIKLLGAIAAGVIVLVAVFKIEFLYNLIGSRLDSLWNFFSDGETDDSSITKRVYLIDMAKTFFYRNPILGVGFNNYSSELAKSVGFASYAHNNYAEIASDLGIVGLAVYYWFYIYLSVRLVKKLFTNHDYVIISLTLIFTIAIFEYGVVNYYKTVSQIIITLIYCCLCVSDYEESLEQYRMNERIEKLEF